VLLLERKVTLGKRDLVTGAVRDVDIAFEVDDVESKTLEANRRARFAGDLSRSSHKGEELRTLLSFSS
jgi:hypothetical protein